MLISYKLSLSDFMAAQHLFYWRKFSSKLTLLSQYFLYPIAGLVCICFLLIRWQTHSSSSSQAGIFGGSAVCLFVPLIFRFNLRRAYKRSRVVDDNCNLNFNDENIQTDLPGYSKSTVEWQAVRHYQEDKKSILVYISPRLFFAIPKRAITSGQRDELIALLQRKIEPKKI